MRRHQAWPQSHPAASAGFAATDDRLPACRSGQQLQFQVVQHRYDRAAMARRLSHGLCLPPPASCRTDSASDGVRLVRAALVVSTAGKEQPTYLEINLRSIWNVVNRPQRLVGVGRLEDEFAKTQQTASV